MAQILPAIVKLALLGSNPDDSSILDEQLHSFRYDVIKSEAGGSYTYTIELINYDERFIEGIIQMYSLLQSDVTTPTSIKSFTAANTVAGDKGAITFPKLLIQWGYPEAMSGVHVAQISNISYKFTQAKEKILLITAVDISEMYKEYASNIVSTVPRNISMSVNVKEDRGDTNTFGDIDKHPYTKSIKIANHLGEPLPFSRIIQNVIGDLVASMPTAEYRPLSTGDLLSFSDSTSSFFSNIIEGLAKGYGAIPPMLGGNSVSFQEIAYSKNEKVDYYGFYIKAIKRLFTYFGIELVENDFENMGTGYISISQEKELENGVFGTTTNVISKDQISSTQYDKVFKSQEKVAFELPVEFDRDSGNPVIVDILEYEARAYAERVLNHPWGIPPGLMQSVHLTFDVPNSDLELFRKDPPEKTAYKSNAVFTVKGFNYEGNPYPVDKKSLKFFNSDPFSPETRLVELVANNKTRVPDGEPEQQLGHILQEHQTRLEKLNRDMYEEGLSGVLSTPGPLSGITVTEKRFTDLTDAEKLDLEYNNLQYFIDSPQGVPVTTTIRSIIDKYNNLVGYPELKIDMVSESIRHEDSFEKVLQRIFDNTTDIPTTVFYMGLKSAVSDLSLKTLPPILSTLSDSKSRKILRLDYGGEHANVKYFDFSSDNRYLANLLAAQVSMNSFKTFQNYLSYGSMSTTLVPILGILAEYLEKSLESMQHKPESPSLSPNSKMNAYKGGLGGGTEFVPPTSVRKNEIAEADWENKDFGDSTAWGWRTSVKTPYFDPEAKEKTKMIKIFIEGAQTMLNGTPADVEVHAQFWDSLESAGVVELMDNIMENRASGIDEDGALALNIFYKAVSNPQYVALLFSKKSEKRILDKGDIGERVSLITDALGVSGYTALEEPSPPPTVYSILTKNPFDISLKNTLDNDVNLSLDFYLKNITSMFEIKVKALGIPEMDTFREISAPRLIDFNVEDIHNTFVADDYNHNTHWLSGVYGPLAMSHQIDVKGGYTTEFKLIKYHGL